MKIALSGKAGAGTPELFCAISGQEPTAGRGQRIATVKVPDPRVDALAEIWHPKKKIYVEARYLDISPEAQTGTADEALSVLSTCDALAYLVSTLPTGDKPPDAARDLRDFGADLLVRDQVVLERKLERMAKANDKGPQRELCERLHAHVEQGKPIRTMGLSEVQRRELTGFGFLTMLPLLAVVNVDESAAASPVSSDVLALMHEEGGQALALSVGLEAEIARLEEADQAAFLAEAGLKEPAAHRFLSASFNLLNLISFLTMGEDECRAWSVERGAKAPRAAGRVHTDIERGFIRAEVIAYDDFIAQGSEAACRKAGKLRVEGKDYVVQDGDILNFRFNV